MSRLDASAIYQLARQAGFTGAYAVTATAVALAESGGITDNIGDRNLTTPGEQSTGLWQINYRPTRDARGGVRDPQANLDPGTNARNAYAIAGGGKNFTPWTTYTTGAYRKYLPAALAAAGGAAVPAGPGMSSSFAPSAAGPRPVSTGTAAADPNAGNPFTSSGGGLLGSIFGNVVGGIGHLILPTLFVLGGVVLVVGGVYKAATATGVAPKTVPIPVPI